jgi:hypothetical protein
MTILPSLGHAFHTGAPVSVFVHFSPKIIYYLLFIVQTPLPSVITFFVVTVGDFLSFCHMQPMSPLDWSSTYHLPLSASSISSEYPTGQLPLPSEFVHRVPPLAQLSTGLVVPLTLDLVTRLWPLFLLYMLEKQDRGAIK